MIISFGWTSAALLAGEKYTTLREWAPRHAAHFHAGDIIDAWDRGPRMHGHKIGTIRLLRAPIHLRIYEVVQAGMAGLPGGLEALWRSEGFAFYHAHPDERPQTIFGESARAIDFGLEWFIRWVGANLEREFWLLRFELLNLEAA